MTVKLGNLKNRGLKSVWPHEEYDFTPWLAEESHFSALSAAIGMDLHVEHIEVPVGPYSADILAKDASGGFVVIENQFGKTDHDHLGKLLTYGATLGASAVVWIAEHFSDEHRKAVEWLNERTTEEFSLYAIQLEVLQIDESLPAIRFNVISQPNELGRQATAAKAGPLTETQQLQLEFWTMFRDRLLGKKVMPSTQTPRPLNWFDIGLGHSNIFLSNTVDAGAGRLGVRVYIRNAIADVALRELEKDKAAIENEIGEKLEWNPMPDRRDKVIGLYRNVDLSNHDDWPEYCDWMVRFVEKFRKAFMPRIKGIKLTEVAAVHE